MTRISELSHSYTTFLLPFSLGAEANAKFSNYEIRWFTTSTEEVLCGHGVVAAAIALNIRYGTTSFNFKTQAGTLISSSILPTSDGPPADIQIGSTVTRVTMRFPASPTTPTHSLLQETRAKLVNALEASSTDILAIETNNLKDVFIDLHPQIDFSANRMAINAIELARACPGSRSQVLTSCSPANGSFDFRKRVFAYGVEG